MMSLKRANIIRLLILILINISNISHATYNAYVSSTGASNTICSISSPCGTFQIVLHNILNGYINDDNIIITISGTNSLYSSSDSTYCVNNLNGNITFNFNTNTISTANHWFPNIDGCIATVSCGCISPGNCPTCHLFTISENSNIKFNGLIWDKDWELLDSLKGSSFYCENCIFRDMTNFGPWPLFLFSNKATFYNSIFNNINSDTDTVIGLFPWKGTMKSDQTDSFLNISHCRITNIITTNFITLESRLDYKKTINIEYCTISTASIASNILTKFIYVSYSLTFSNAINKINIDSSSFVDNTNHEYNAGLVVLYVAGSAECDISMNNINISYSQKLSADLLGSTFNPKDVVINIQSQYSLIIMNNIMITTQIYCSYDLFGVAVGRRRRMRDLLQAFSQNPDMPYCNSPPPFLLNNGIAELNNIELQTDYSSTIWSTYFGTAGDTAGEYKNGGIYFLRLLYYDSTLDTDNEPYFAAIFNDYNGVLKINNFRVAIGAHFGILYNRGGSVYINGLYTEFHDNDQSEYYNRWNLRLHSGITNNFGVLNITNSVIQGSDISLIDIYGGDVMIKDTILAQSMMGIVTYYLADNIYLDNINVYEIGKYYASLGASFYYSDSNDPLSSVAPIVLSANYINILNSKFYYIGALGILNINKYGILNLNDGNMNIKTVNMMNNEFIVTETKNSTSTYKYDGFNYFINFDYLLSLLTESYGSRIPINDISTFINNGNIASNNNVNGLIVIDNQYELSMGNNNIFIEPGNYIEINNKYLYINTEQENCIAANNIFNMDLYINSGNMKSCKHSEMNTTKTTQCFQGLGSVNNTFLGSDFINSSIIITDAVNTVIIDNAVLYHDEAINPVHFVNVNNLNIQFILLDTILAETVDLIFPGFCNINCHEIVNNNISQIRQLIVDCKYNASLITNNISVRNNTDFESFNYWSVNSIVLNDNNMNGDTLIFPGGTIDINYKIIDAYNNIIDKYPYNIAINLVNTDLNINNYLIINENGECNLCESGLYVQGISIKNINKLYTISAMVLNNKLLTNNINIKIIECPSGYGISGAAEQCDECNDGTYSILSNSEECDECNDDKLDGIQCIGGNNISIDYNYWMKIINNNNSSVIISSDCPNKYCCQISDGCDYLKDLVDNKLCALNRDPMEALCGQCINGYSELLGTVNCGICDRNYYEYLLLPVTISIIFCIYLLCFDRSNKEKQDDNKRKNKPKELSAKKLVVDDIRALSIMIFKVLLYYGQGLLYIIAQSNINDGIFYFILPILQLFNLSIDFGINSNSVNSGYCFIDGMTASQEILLNLIIPILLLTITGIAILTKFCNINLMKICCCCCKRKKNGIITYYSAFLRALLISIGTIIAVMFKLLSCRDISNDNITINMVHYYFGSVECYDGLWIFALIMLFIIIILWFILNICLWRMDINKRQSIYDNNLYTLVRAYHVNHWWWESVLLSRRMFLALFTIITDKNNYLHIILNVLLCIYLSLQIWKQPFIYNRINKLETICILILIIVLGFVNANNAFLSNEENSTEKTILALFLLICIMFPILIVLYEGYRICKHSRIKKISQKKYDKIELRRPSNTKKVQLSATQ